MDMCLRDSSVFPSDPHAEVFAPLGPALVLSRLGQPVPSCSQRKARGNTVEGETILEVKKYDSD